MKLRHDVFLPLAVLFFALPLLAQSNLAAPAVKLSPTSLTFGQQIVGTVSPGQSVSLTNLPWQTSPW